MHETEEMFYEMSDPRGILFYKSRQQIKNCEVTLVVHWHLRKSLCLFCPSHRSVSPGPGDRMILVEEGDQTLSTAVSERVINGNNRVKGVCGAVLRADILRFERRK